MQVPYILTDHPRTTFQKMDFTYELFVGLKWRDRFSLSLCVKTPLYSRAVPWERQLSPSPDVVSASDSLADCTSMYLRFSVWRQHCLSLSESLFHENLSKTNKKHLLQVWQRIVFVFCTSTVCCPRHFTKKHCSFRFPGSVPGDIPLWQAWQIGPALCNSIARTATVTT
jgi:hypothetical protein